MAVTAVTREQMPPAVSGRRPGVGHTVEFLRNPVGLLERGLAEQGRVFSVRLGNRDAVVLLGPEHHEFFFSETDKLLSIRTAYPFFVEMFGERFWYFAGDDERRRQRALVVPRFQGRQLEGYVEAMAAETEALLDRLGTGGSFDLVPTLGPLVMRIAGRAFLGEEFSARLGDGFFREFRKFSGGMEPVLPLWLPLPRLLRSKQARAGLHRTLGALIAERRRRPLDPPRLPPDPGRLPLRRWQRRPRRGHRQPHPPPHLGRPRDDRRPHQLGPGRPALPPRLPRPAPGPAGRRGGRPR